MKSATCNLSWDFDDFTLHHVEVTKGITNLEYLVIIGYQMQNENEGLELQTDIRKHIFRHKLDHANAYTHANT